MNRIKKSKKISHMKTLNHSIIVLNYSIPGESRSSESDQKA